MVDRRRFRQGGAAEEHIGETEELVVFVGEQDMQQIVEVQVGVGDRRSGEGGEVNGLLRQGQGGGGVLPAYFFDLVDLVENQQGLGPDQGKQVLQHVAHRFIVYQNQVYIPGVIPQRRPSGRRCGQSGAMEIQDPQGLLSGEAQEKLVHPGAEGVLGADHHQPLDEPPAFQAGVDPQHRSGFTGAGDGEVGRPLHGKEKEGVPHLPFPQGPGHGGVHHGLVFPESGEQLLLPVFDLYAQAEPLLQVVAPVLDIVRQSGGDREDHVSFGAFRLAQADDALKVQVGQGGLAGEQAALLLFNIAAEGEFIKSAVGQSLRLFWRKLEGQGGVLVV